MKPAAATPVLTPLQQDLLRAAFGTGDPAVAAWHRWRGAIDWDAHLDRDAFRLLPPTGRNLRRLGVNDPLQPRLLGVTRQAWYANQHRLRRLSPTLRSLAAAGVELLVLPPAAVLLRDAGAIVDWDVPLGCAVPGPQAESAIHCLWRHGWHAAVRLPHWSVAGYVLAADSLAWWNRDGQRLDLRWQWDARASAGRLSAEVWARAEPARLATEPVLALDPADAVHDLCRQPLAGSAFGRIVDLLLHLDAAQPPPDWQRFLARAALAPVDPAWRGIFGELQALLPALIPGAVVADWPVAGPAPAAATATGSMGARVAAHWSAYRRAWGSDYSLAGALRHLPGYLLARWQLPELGRIPRRLWQGLRYEWRAAQRSR